MAGRLERVYGTDEEKVNCPFYRNIGACRYENKCSRIHSIPPISQTILFKHMYKNSPIEVAIASENAMTQAGIEEALEKFESFYEDVFLKVKVDTVQLDKDLRQINQRMILKVYYDKLAEFGEIQDLIVCENFGDHLVGNIYVKYTSELFAELCFNALQNLSYENRPLQMEYSLADFSRAQCKKYIDGTCQRGGACNYLHLKKISTKFKKSLFNQMYEEHPEYREKTEKEVTEKSLKQHKKKEKQSSNSRESSRRNSIERQKMINDWNETGIQNVCYPHYHWYLGFISTKNDIWQKYACSSLYSKSIDENESRIITIAIINGCLERNSWLQLRWVERSIIYIIIYILIMRRKNWRPEVYNLNLSNKEDKALLEICKSQHYNWRRVSKQMISIGYKRSGKSCKERFHNQLNPYVNKDQWTQNEVDKLFELQSKYGNRWRIIAKELPQRTDGLIKNYFYSLVRKVLRRLSKTVNGTKNGSQMTKTLKPSVISQIFCVNQNQVNDAGIEVEFAELFRNIILKYKNFNLSQQIDIEDIDKIKSIFQTLQLPSNSYYYTTIKVRVSFQLSESYNDDLEKKNISKSRSKSHKIKTKLSNVNIDHLILQKIQLKHPIFTMKSCPLPKLYSKFVFHHNTYHPTQLMYQSISSFTSQNIDQNNSYGAILIKPEQLLFFQPPPSPYYTMNISAFIQQQSSMHTYYSSYFNPTPEIKEEHET